MSYSFLIIFLITFFKDEIIYILNYFFNVNIILENHYFKLTIYYINKYILDQLVLYFIIYFIFTYFSIDITHIQFDFATDSPVDSHSSSSNSSNSSTANNVNPDDKTAGQMTTDFAKRGLVNASAAKVGYQAYKACPQHLGVKIAVGFAACALTAAAAHSGVQMAEHYVKPYMETAQNKIDELANQAKPHVENIKDKIVNVFNKPNTLIPLVSSNTNINLKDFPFSLLNDVQVINTCILIFSIVILNSYIVKYCRKYWLSLEQKLPNNKIGVVLKFFVNRYFNIWQNVSNPIIIFSTIMILFGSLVNLISLIVINSY